jgi:hypothetical protein
MLAGVEPFVARLRVAIRTRTTSTLTFVQPCHAFAVWFAQEIFVVSAMAHQITMASLIGTWVRSSSGNKSGRSGRRSLS